MEWLKRGFLVLGVVVALTPCGLCHASSETGMTTMKSCHMASMSDMKCCHSGKTQSPLCKVMGQSSVVSVLHVAPLVVAPMVSAPLAGPSLSVQGFISAAVGCSFASPHRGPLSLRI